MRDLMRATWTSLVMLLGLALLRPDSIINSSDDADKDAAKDAVRAYVEASANANFEAVCGSLSRAGRAIVLATATAEGLKTDSCAAALSHLMRQQASSAAPARDFMLRQLRNLAYTVELLDADRAIVVIDPPPLEDHADQRSARLPLVKEDGNWKIGVSGLEDQRRTEVDPPASA